MNQFEEIVNKTFTPRIKEIFDKHQKYADRNLDESNDIKVACLTAEYDKIRTQLLKAYIRYNATNDKNTLDWNKTEHKIELYTDQLVFKLAETIAETKGYYRITIKGVHDHKIFFNVKTTKNGDFAYLASFVYALNKEGLHAFIKHDLIYITDPKGNAHCHIEMLKNTQTGKLNVFVKQDIHNGDTTSPETNAMLFDRKDDVAFIAKAFHVFQDRMA